MKIICFALQIPLERIAGHAAYGRVKEGVEAQQRRRFMLLCTKQSMHPYFISGHAVVQAMTRLYK